MFGTDRCFYAFDFFFEVLRGEYRRAGTPGDDLDDAVAGGYGDVVVMAEGVGEFFDVFVGGLGFFGEDDVQIVIAELLDDVAGDAVGVEDDDGFAGGIAGVV